MVAVVLCYGGYPRCCIIVFVVCMERGQRQLPLTYPKRQQAGGRNMSQNNSRLPLKINMVGVLPPIIATALISFPLAAAEFFSELYVWIERGRNPRNLLDFSHSYIES